MMLVLAIMLMMEVLTYSGPAGGHVRECTQEQTGQRRNS